MRDAIETSDARIFVKSFQHLLDAEAERRLFQAWWDSNPAAAQAFFDPENEDVTCFQGGDDDTHLTKIILAYGPIIRKAIKELSGYKMPEEDLLSEGLIALAEAARRFNPDRNDGTRFATYAKVCVKGMMQGYIMKNFFFVHMCTNHTKKTLFYALRRLIAVELHKHGHFRMTPAVAKKLAEEHKLPEHEVVQMYEMFRHPYVSLDAKGRLRHLNDPNNDEADGSFGDIIPSTESNAEDIVLDTDEVEFHKKIVRSAINNVLTEREKKIFIAQILAEDKSEQRTLDDLGDEYGVSKERVRQLRILAEKKVDEEIIRLVGELGLSPRDLFSG